MPAGARCAGEKPAGIIYDAGSIPSYVPARPMPLSHAPLRLAALLLVAATAGAAEPPSGSAADAVATLPAGDAPSASPAAAPTAPPLPALEHAFGRHRLNWFGRADIAALPEDARPKVKPWCNGAYLTPTLPPLDGDDRAAAAPVYIAADTMQLDEDGESQVAGDVVVRQGQRLVHADNAVLSADRQRVKLDGNVRVQDPGLTLEAGSADIALDGSGGTVSAAAYALHAQHIRGDAREIVRRGEYVVEISDGGYTTCEPDADTWYLGARHILLDQEEGWGEATHVLLNVQDVPVFYTPWVRFPIDERRRTGVLYPTLGYSTDNGGDIALPVYLNLDPQYDLLLTPRWIGERGTLLEGEARLLHGDPAFSLGESRLGAGWIESDARYADRERSITTFRHLGYPHERLQLLADGTYVSDDDYLDDLGTQLSVNRDANLLQLAQATWSGNDYTALVRAQAYQTIDPTLRDRKLPYRRLPQVLLNGSHPIAGESGFTALGAAEFVAFERDVELATTANPVGERRRLEPGIGYLWERPGGYVAPVAKLRYVNYALDDNPAGDDPEHAIPTASLDSRLFLERRIGEEQSPWTQTLEPRAFLLWTPYEDQRDAPVFDTSEATFSYDQLFRDNRFVGGDRIGDVKQLSFAVESRLINDAGSEKARFAVGQAWYQGDRRVRLNPGALPRDEPRSPLVTEAGWQLSESWRTRGELQWLDDSNEVVRGSFGFFFQDAAFRTLNLGYRYDAPNIDQSDLSGILPLGAHWSLVGRWVFNLDTSRSLESLGGIEYESCCWRARLAARRSLAGGARISDLEPEESVVLEVELKGLGAVGERISTQLANDIPGYDKRQKTLD
jgi:LPS-assembly protein